MIKKTLVLTLVCGIGFLLNLNAQNILTIDGNSISKQEFEDIYKKNNKELTPTKGDLDDYMELFINYKLKVMEAEKMKMDTIVSFKKELEGYRNQLAAPYLIDKDKTGALVKEAYERMQTEVRASHILIGFKPRAAKDDTLKEYNQVMAIRKSILSGEKTFEEMAVAKSTDPSAKSNKGDLGYFKSLQMVYPFESAAYNTAVGEISQPVKTRFGYHLVKVVDKRPSPGEIKAAHILILSSPKASQKEKLVAEERINEIYKELKNGKSFSSLAIKYSADKTSAKAGGELPQFGSGKMVKEFEDEAFALENDGDFSRPFQTTYGWHIVKRIGRVPVPSMDEMEKELKDRISKDSRANITKQSFLAKLRNEYNFKEKRKTLDAMYNLVDSNIFRGKWQPGNHGLNKTMFTIAKEEFTQADFVKYLQFTQGRTDGIDLKGLVDKKFEAFKDDRLMRYENNRLEEKYPKFKSLMREYRDGILLFNLTEEKIWGRAAKDTLGLQSYYDNHKEEFRYDRRVKATIAQCKTSELADQVSKMMTAGKSSKEINDQLNDNSKLNVILESGTFEKTDKEVLRELPFEIGISEIKELDGQFLFANITEVLEDGIRPFDQSKGLVTAAYQKYLEDEWIKELRSAHEIKVNQEVLYSVK